MQPESHLVLPLPFPPPLSLPPTTRELSSSFMGSSPSSVTQQQFDPNPRKKKRSKTMAVKVDDPEKPRPKKPDPNAPKITRPCTECGKRFWSWKALFGHMRCHPERQWRGINPPPNLRSLLPQKAHAGLKETESFYQVRAVMTEEDHEVAECLLKLADGPVVAVDRGGGGGVVVVGQMMGSYEDAWGGATTWQQFECTSCKKVFGSHQALGGHRASHKNVKGCFAMTRSGDCSEEPFLGITEVSSEGAMTTTTITGFGGGNHRCGICNRVFPSGQALGGHKRCHWEKGEEEEEEEGGQFLCLDLNQPAAPLTADEDSSSSSHLSDLTLDLRLGL